MDEIAKRPEWAGIIDQYTNHLTFERGLSRKTVATYKHHTATFMKHLSEKKIGFDQTQKNDLATYVAALRKKGLMSATLFVTIMALRSFYRFLLGKGAIKFDPTDKLSLPKISSRIPEPLSIDQANQVVSAPPKKNFIGLRDRALLEVLYCGLRIGEALGLDVDHLHLEPGYIKVHGKGDKERLVPIGRKATEALNRYLVRRHKKNEPTGPLFISQKGFRLSPCEAWRRVKLYASMIGIKQRVYPHLMRHSYATSLLSEGVDLRSVQLLLGHVNLNTTQKYLTISFANLQKTCGKAHPRF